MMDCWHKDPNRRPSFTEARLTAYDFSVRLMKVIDFPTILRLHLQHGCIYVDIFSNI